MKQDFYALLGVAPDAPEEAIQKACHGALSVTSDSAHRVLLRHARDTLCDPQRRAAYDRSLPSTNASSSPNAASAPHSTAAPVPARATPRARAPMPVESSSPLRWWLGLASLVLVVGGVGYQLGKPKATASPPLVSNTAGQQPHAKLSVPANARTHAAMQTTATDAANATGANALSPEAIYANVAPSVLVIESLNASGQPISRGSGVVIASELVLTNCHVVMQASAVRVRSGSSEYAAISDTSDTQLDLCQLRVPGLGAAPVRRGTVKQVRVGQTVFAIGTPHDLERTLSQGLVSALRETPDGTLIQTSASISPGSSGGGLFDNEGRLIGITTFQHKQGQNLNFALPVDFIDILRNR